jgi:voltage-gated potassium channel Kch
MMLYSHPLYERLAPWRGVFERRKPFRELAVERKPIQADAVQVIVFGLGRYGSRLLRQLHASGVKVVGIDFDPETVREFKLKRLPVHYGDAESPDFLESLPLSQARWIVSTLPQQEANHLLLHGLRAAGYQGQLAVAVRDEHLAASLQQVGIHKVFMPFQDAASHAAEQLLAELQATPQER